MGQGAFGQVIKGYDTAEEREVAIKLEPTNAKYPQLLQEAKIYQLLEDNLGVPQIYFAG